MVSSSAAPSSSATPALTKAGGVWTEPPPLEPRDTSQRAMSAGATMEEATAERPKKKLRRRPSGRPWPDTYGVALRSTAMLQNARPLDPLTPLTQDTTLAPKARSTSPPQVVSSSEDSEDRWGGWKPAGARQAASGARRPKTPPKASGALGSRAPETLPKALVAPLTPPRRHRSHLFHHRTRHQSRFFRHRARHQHHCLHRRRPLEFLTCGLQ